MNREITTEEDYRRVREEWKEIAKCNVNSQKAQSLNLLLEEWEQKIAEREGE